MQKICESAIFEFKDEESDLINEISIYLDKNADTIWEFFEIEKSDKKPKIILYNDKEYFDTAYRRDNNLPNDYIVPNWSVGTGTQDGNINLLSLNAYKGTPHEFNQNEYDKALLKFKRRVVHEYVHFVNMQFNQIHNCSFTARFLVEGVAILLSEQYKDYLSPQIDCTKEQILNKRDCKYANYYLLTRTLVNNYDKSFVLQLFKSSREANEFLDKTLFEQTSKKYERSKI